MIKRKDAYQWVGWLGSWSWPLQLGRSGRGPRQLHGGQREDQRPLGGLPVEP
jgi:hypothetical protein